MLEFVIEGHGKVPWILSSHTDKNPLAIVTASSIGEAIDKYIHAHQEYIEKDIIVQSQ